MVGVGRVVEHLGEANRVDVPGDPRQCQRQHIIGEAGIDAGGEERASTRQCGGPQRAGDGWFDGVGIDKRDHRAGHHIFARPQNPHHVVERLEHPKVAGRRVDHHICVAPEQTVRIPAGKHTHRVDPAQFAGVAAGLGLAMHHKVDQLRLRMVNHRA